MNRESSTTRARLRGRVKAWTEELRLESDDLQPKIEILPGSSFTHGSSAENWCSFRSNLLIRVSTISLIAYDGQESDCWRSDGSGPCGCGKCLCPVLKVSGRRSAPLRRRSGGDRVQRRKYVIQPDQLCRAQCAVSGHMRAWRKTEDSRGCRGQLERPAQPPLRGLPSGAERVCSFGCDGQLSRS